MPGKILIIGADSEIAGAATQHLAAHGHKVVATTRRPERVAAHRPCVDRKQHGEAWPIPDDITTACLCAAIARLADCARDPEASARVNVSGTIALADRLLAHGIPVLFLSTDKVFDGSRPNVPADAPPCPLSEYGRQKATAETALRERMATGAPVAILRLAKVVSPGMDLLRQWLASLAAGKPIRAFHDMHMAPTPVALVAAAIESLLAGPVSGIFQLTGPRDVAYSEVAQHLARALGADQALIEMVSAIASGQPEGSTARHTTLDSSALRKHFGIAVPEASSVIDALIETCR
jgi:dTDP-4-dehydrorhamnose reductase